MKVRKNYKNVEIFTYSVLDPFSLISTLVSLTLFFELDDEREDVLSLRSGGLI